MKNEIKNKITLYVSKKTSEGLYSQNYENMGTIASEVADAFFIDRSNSSRILNELFIKGKLCKKVGRPTLYFCLDTISKIHPNNTCPKIISSNQTIEQFLHNKTNKTISENSFLFKYKHIGYSANESMYLPIINAKKILFYPDKTKILFINGANSYSKDIFIDSIRDYYKSTHFIINNSQYVACTFQDSSNLLDYNMIGEIISKTKGNRIILLKLTSKSNVSIAESLYTYLRQQCLKLIDKFIFLIDIDLINSNTKTYNFLPIVTIPDYTEFTVKERIEYVLKYVHNEACNINKTFTFNKQLVSCLALCTLTTNLESLKELIHYTCMNGYSTGNVINAGIKLTIDDLPHEILNYVECSNDLIDKANDMLQLFPLKVFNAFPNIEFAELNTLLNATIDENQNLTSANTSETSSIINVCKMDIERYQSPYVKDQYISNANYNRLLSILNNSNLLKEKDSIILCYHLCNVIDEISSGKFQDKSILTEKKKYTSLSKDVIELINTIEKTFSISLCTYEKIYINTFIIYTNDNYINTKVGIIFCMSNSRLSDIYSLIVNQRYGENFSNASSISFSKFCDDYDLNFKVFANELSKLKYNKAIIILTDSHLPINLICELKCTIKSEIKIVTNLSFLQIERIYNLYKSPNITIDNLDSLDNYSNNYNTDVIEIDDSKTLFEVLNKTLQGQLLFLDAHKVVPLLITVFKSILDDLSMDFSNNLLIDFIMHTIFLLERTIKDNPLPYKSINKLQRKNSRIYNIVYKNFSSIESFFNFKIKDTEYAYIVEMFVDAINTCE